METAFIRQCETMQEQDECLDRLTSIGILLLTMLSCSMFAAERETVDKRSLFEGKLSRRLTEPVVPSHFFVIHISLELGKLWFSRKRTKISRLYRYSVTVTSTCERSCLHNSQRLTDEPLIVFQKVINFSQIHLSTYLIGV